MRVENLFMQFYEKPALKEMHCYTTVFLLISNFSYLLESLHAHIFKEIFFRIFISQTN